MSLSKARIELNKYANAEKAANHRRFFKNSQDDTFLGVPAPQVRQVAKQFFALSLQELQVLMCSKVHEERSLAHKILCLRFQRGSEDEQKSIFDFYIENRNYIRDWDGVDDTAPYIAGPYLLHRDKSLLYQLAGSNNLWDRRIAIVSTWWFIRQGHFTDTLEIARLLLQDREDLIHKATGWMLRELGKRDLISLKHFLSKHASRMPRTMLRYAIERFTPEDRKKFLRKTTESYD